MKNKGSLKNGHRWEEAKETEHQLQSGTQDWLLEQEGGITGKTDEASMKSMA